MNRRLVGNFQNALWLRRQKLLVGEFLSISRKIALKCGLTASPSGESRTGGPRSNKGPPSGILCFKSALGLEERGNQVKDEEYQRDHCGRR
jgi:hypothetical protein